MQTVQKALSLLNYFTEQTPDFGLTEMARTSGFDKASTRRLLVALQSKGFVEQDVNTRRYTLGSAILRLAKIRESIRPTHLVVAPILSALMEAAGETAHFSLYAGGQLGTVAAIEPSKANRVILQEGEVLPVHASASGLAYLAFAPPSIVKTVLAKKMTAFTSDTVTDVSLIRQMLTTVREQGYAVSRNGFEDGVCGIAAPVFTAGEFAEGAVAVAAPGSRVDTTDLEVLRKRVIATARRISAELGAAYPIDECGARSVVA